MAIFFGDELRSANADFPIIDISENNAKGVVFVDSLADFTAPNVPYQKITVGMVVVDRSSGDVYVYKGDGFTNTDGTTGNNSPDSSTDLTDPNGGGETSVFAISGNADWKVIGNTPIFSGDLTFNVPDDLPNGQTRTFGKYNNGETLDWTGKTALDAIRDALISYIAFESSDITGVAGGSYPEFPFKITERLDESVTARKFKVRNKNRPSISSTYDADANGPGDYGISEISVTRTSYYGAFSGGISYTGGAWVGTGKFDQTNYPSNYTSLKNAIVALNENGNEDYVTVTFDDDNVDIPARASGTTHYSVTVTPINDAGVVQAAVTSNATGPQSGFKVRSYDEPYLNISLVQTNVPAFANSLFNYNNSNRPPGHVSSTLTCTVKNNAQADDDTIDISTIELQRRHKIAGSNSFTQYNKIHGIGGTGEDPIPASLNDGTPTNFVFTVNDGANASEFSGSETGEFLPAVDLAQVQYRLVITDNGAASSNTENGGNGVMTFRLPVIIGYSDQNPVNNTGSVMATAVESMITSSSSFPLRTTTSVATNNSGVPSSTTVINLVDGETIINVPNEEYIYVVVPENGVIGGITDGAVNIFNDFIDDNPHDFGRGTTEISVEFANGVTYDYNVYAAPTAGDGGGTLPYPKLVITA